MKAYFLTPIRSRVDAVRFVDALIEDGRAYHLDDDPAETFDVFTGARTFSDAEAVLLRRRCAEMRRVEGFDPFEQLVQLAEG